MVFKLCVMYLERVNADSLLMSAGSYLESAIVAFHQRGIGGLRKLDELLNNFQIRIEAFDLEQAK